MCITNQNKMEKTVAQVEAMFQKAESTVNYLSQKLEFEFENNDELEVNPARMVQTVNEVKKEYASLVQEAGNLQEAQKDAVQEFQKYLGTAVGLLQKLDQHSGQETCERPEELGQLEQLLGIKFPPSLDSQQPGETTPADRGDDRDTLTGAVSSLAAADSSNDDGSSCSCTAEPPMSPFTRRKQSHDFIELSKEEFESVAELIRGRVKLAEVNSTYRILWQHFKEKKNSAAIGSAEMYTLGMRVAGQTGQAKLKVLRALKFLKMSVKGDVTLN